MSGGDVLVSTLTVDPGPVKALAALFDDGLPVAGPGDRLPPLWHWAALARWPGSAGSGVDGHPATGGFLPDVGKPRRMFAGGTVTEHRPLVVGSTIRREERVVEVVQKRGRGGDFVLVRVESRLHDADDRLAVVEVQDLVYRDRGSTDPDDPAAAGLPPAPLGPVPSLLAEEGGTWRFRTDPARLMRFSSATSNGHRIHYDHPYAVGVEGYPGLVVHGPLMTIALAQVLRATDDGRPRIIAHRNLRPLFCGQRAIVESASARHAAGEHSLVLVANGIARAELSATLA